MGFISRWYERRSMHRAEQKLAQLNAQPQNPKIESPGAPETYPNGEQFPARPLQVRTANELYPTARPIDEMSYDRGDEQCRRFLTGTRPPDEIEAVTEREAEAPQRFYAALLHGNTAEERMEHLVQAMLTQKDNEGQTAFDQEYLVLIPGTGSGFIEPQGPNAIENFSDGKAATAALQYNNEPSFLSIPETNLGKKEFEILLRRVNEEIRKRRDAGQSVPKLVVLGESMGATVVAKTIKGHEKELSNPDSNYHIDRFLLTGLPGRRWNHFRKLFKDQPWENGQVVSKDGQFAKIDAKSDPTSWASAPYVVANNNNDAVSRAGAIEGMIVKPKDWPEDQSFLPLISFFKAMGNPGKTTRPPPGQFSENGHDYRLRKCELIAHVIFDGQVSKEIVAHSVEREFQAEKDREAQLAK